MAGGLVYQNFISLLNLLNSSLILNVVGRRATAMAISYIKVFLSIVSIGLNNAYGLLDPFAVVVDE